MSHNRYHEYLGQYWLRVDPLCPPDQVVHWWLALSPLGVLPKRSHVADVCRRAAVARAWREAGVPLAVVRKALLAGHHSPRALNLAVSRLVRPAPASGTPPMLPVARLALALDAGLAVQDIARLIDAEGVEAHALAEETLRVMIALRGPGSARG